MTGRALLQLAGVATLLWSTPGRAQWLEGPSRALPLGDSASPDAPASSYAYGPRARASVGGDLALITFRRDGRAFRLGAMVLAAFENAESYDAIPDETVRIAWEVSSAWAFESALAPGSVLELSLDLGRRSAYATTELVHPDPYHPDDVPFGAGGAYFGADAGFRAPFASRWTFLSRYAFRAYTNAFPNAVGATEASNYVADVLREGAELQMSFELGARWELDPAIEPLARGYIEGIVPHDDSAKTLWLARLLVGAALPSRAWELTPFLDGEAGHGSGLMVNRTELRFGGGVKLNAR